MYHRCQSCGYETDVSSGLAVFDDNPHCSQCGLSGREADTKMQDELADMMSHNLHINNTIQHHSHDISLPPTPQVVPHQAPITYITQHYTHSAHLVASSQNESSASDILASAGVNSSVLFPSQIQLFKNAQPEQQARLIELWRIAPPTSGSQLLGKDLGNWPQTSIQHEEEAARARWERTEQLKVKNMCTPQGPREAAEPYIIHGYQSLPNVNGLTAPTEYGSSRQGQTKEPRGASREWWRFPDNQMSGLQLDQSDERMDEDML